MPPALVARGLNIHQSHDPLYHVNYYIFTYWWFLKIL